MKMFSSPKNWVKIHLAKLRFEDDNLKTYISIHKLDFMWSLQVTTSAYNSISLKV